MYMQCWNEMHLQFAAKAIHVTTCYHICKICYLPSQVYTLVKFLVCTPVVEIVNWLSAIACTQSPNWLYEPRNDRILFQDLNGITRQLNWHRFVLLAREAPDFKETQVYWVICCLFLLWNIVIYFCAVTKNTKCMANQSFWSCDG